MKSYLDIVKTVLEHGEWKENRTGVKTLVVPNIHFTHNMADGFPLLTTKKMAWKSVATELEGFIGGITDKKWYQERNCKIWNEWSNPESDDNDDLGPIYGYQWRAFGVPYEKNQFKYQPANVALDQFGTIIHKLKTNPDDRRLVCSAWSPQQLHQMALPACHVMWILTHINGKLNLHWTQRSCDLILGVPFNIASYGLLLELLCKESGLKPGNLSGMLCDCHIYENHVEGAKLQLEREPYELSKLSFKDWKGIFKWRATDTKLSDYQSHEKISFQVAV